MQTIIIVLNNNLTLDQASKVYKITKIVFQNTKSVLEDGLHLIASLASLINVNFKLFLDDFWNYLAHVFSQQKEDISLFKAAMLAMSDVAQACSLDYLKYLQPTVKMLLDCLNQDFDRKIKIQVFDCFGMLVLGVKENLT